MGENLKCLQMDFAATLEKFFMLFGGDFLRDSLYYAQSMDAWRFGDFSSLRAG